MSVPDQETSYFYTGNGVTTTFAYGFYLLALADIKISLNGVVQTTGFTVNGIGSQTGGAVVFNAAPANGVSVLIERDVAIKRDTDYQPNGDLRSDVLNTDFDRIWMALQDKKRENVRSLRYPNFENLDGLLPNAASRANMVLGFSANGLHTMLPIPASFGAGNLITDVFTSGVDFTPGVTTALTLSRDPGTKDNLLIFFDGVFQGTDQFGLSGTTLTFNAPIPVGVTTVFARIGTTLSISTPPSKSVGDSELQWGDVLSRVVSTIADLKNLAKITYTRAFVLGYYAKGDGGGGAYWLDTSDTTSADNGGTIIVAADGGRWRLTHNGDVSVKQFGAKGDGVTNDLAAIQAAIDIFGTDGGKVWFPPGTYGINGSIILRNEINGFNGQVLEGAGQGVSIKKLSGAGAILNIEGARCTVRGITFNANNIAATGIYCDTLFDGQPTLIENCAFLSCAAGGQGIYNNDGDSYMIRNCYFLGTGNWAVESRNNMMNSTFAANYVQGSGGVHLNSATQQAEGYRITDNTILASGGSGYAVDVEFGLEIIIANNICDQLLNGGVRIRNNASYVKVTNNWFGGGTNSHVNMGDNANRNFVIGNTFEGGTAPQVVANSAALGNINSLTIHNNIHGNIAPAAQGILMINVRRASICGNIMPGAVGADSIFWGTGATGIIANNALWKAPANDGSATVLNNVIG